MEKKYTYPHLVRYELDMLNKEWNALQEVFKQKKKANKADPCVEELEKKKIELTKTSRSQRTIKSILTWSLCHDQLCRKYCP